MRVPSLAVTGLFASVASAGHMAAWWTNDYGPTFMMQDDTSGKMRYSLCNSKDTPIFPNDTSITIPLIQSPPKNNSAVAGSGWFDGTNVIASIFYFNKKNEIMNSLLKCDSTTGHWSVTGDYVISGGAPTAANNSDLAVALLGDKLGYRLFYNDPSGAAHQLAYANSYANGWMYEGVVYNTTTSANVMAITYPPEDDNITMIVPRDSANMGLARAYADKSWHIESFPTPLRTLSNTTVSNLMNPSSLQLNSSFVPSYKLPAWNGKPAALGMSQDSKYTRTVFYIGTDKQLYQVGNLNYQWGLFDRPGNAAWPTADNNYLAVANDFSSSSLRVYYMSNGTMIEANGDNGQWQDSLVLPSASTSSSGSNSSSPDANPDTDSSGLSTGAKAGIGVGVALAVIAIIGIIVAIVLMKKRQRKKQEREKEAAAATSEAGGANGYDSKSYQSPSTMYSSATPGAPASELGNQDAGYHQHQQQYYQQQQQYPQQQQYQQQQVYEMPGQSQRAEMVGEGHYREAP